MVDNFGQFLKHERELRGVPLEEIAGATKIHIRFLRALEDNQFDTLPGEVFIKGYLRSYAKAIGYDAQDLLRAYDSYMGKNPPEKQTVASSPASGSKKRVPLPWAVGGALAAGAVLAFALFGDFGGDGEETANTSPPAVLAESTSVDADPPPPVVTLKEKILATVDEEQDLPPKIEASEDASKVNTESKEKSESSKVKPETSKAKPAAPVASAVKPEKKVSAEPKKNEASPKPESSEKKKLKTQEAKPEKPKTQTTAKNTEAPKPQKREKPAPENKPESKPDEVETAALTPPQKPRSIRQAEEKVQAPVKNPASPPPSSQAATESSVKTAVASPEEKTAPPQTPIESQVSEKNSDSEEKEVIIQSVAEKFTAGAAIVQAPDIEDKALHLMIQVQGNSWFNLAVDGKPEEDFILPGGTSKSFYGDDKFRVTIGNRRGTQLFLNGQALDIPTSQGDVVRDFEITSQFLE